MALPTPSVFINAKQAENAETTQYTSPTLGRGSIIDKFTATNTTAGAVTITVKLVPVGGSASAANTIVVQSIPANSTDTLPSVVGHFLKPGDFISTLAGAATSITIRSSGREFT